MEDANGLGELLSEHEENKTATGSTLLIGLVCFGVAAGMIALFASEEGVTFNRVLAAVGGLSALGGGASCVWSAATNRGGRVRIYEHGLTAERSGAKHSARWDEIAFLYESVEKMHVNRQYVYDRCRYTIVKTDGERFELGNMISDIGAIGRRLREKTFEHLYPIAAAAVGRGVPVRFDSLAVDAAGLAGVAWSEFAAVKVKDGVIEVFDKKGAALVKGAYAATPNAHVLVALLRERLPMVE